MVVIRSTAVPAVGNHGRDAHATGGTTEPDVGNRSTAVPAVESHGQDAHATPKIRHGAHLPHWTVEGAAYFITFRLVDSLPRRVFEGWLFERENIVKTAEQMGRTLSAQEEKRLHELHSDKVETYLDVGHGACFMKNDRIAMIVAETLRHFNGERYDLGAWCVMPNHVHVVVLPRLGQELPDILHSWKSFSAKEANKELGRTGEFWQAESYDHLIRDEADFWRCVEYVLDNPGKARLKDWKWVGTSSTAVSAVESHGRDAHATGDMTDPSVENRSTAAPAVGNHGRDAHATGGTTDPSGRIVARPSRPWR